MKSVLDATAAALLLGALAALPGCQSSTLKVPGTASEVAMGSSDVAYRASDMGRIYVYDRTWDKIRYSGNIRPGQLLVVDSRNDRILIDNVPVVEQISLDDAAQYQIFLDRGGARVVERRTVIEREIRN